MPFGIKNKNMTLKDLFEKINGKDCVCGKDHRVAVKVYSGSGALLHLPEAMAKLGVEHAFILSDKNTHAAAGERVCRLLSENGLKYTGYVFDEEKLEPDERSVGAAFMNYDRACDVIIAVGSGVIGDISKILSAVCGRPMITVATAPSMDGYASATSSMTRAGVKVSLSSKCADVVIGDTDILKEAPIEMLKSGLGDMLAKYVSITEWRISHLITGEYYCETVADAVREALRRCIDNRHGLLQRDNEAVEAVFEGLIITGIAMTYAGLSRPASGVEHYLSHVWDMRSLEFDLPCSLHGLQCGVGTLISARIYDKVKETAPSKSKALAYVSSFDISKWNDTLRTFLGKAAEPMIELEKKEGKYSIAKHSARLDVIIENYGKILDIINEELPSAKEIEEILDDIKAPKSLAQLGIDEDILPLTFKASKDIRDKYVLSRLCWDLGIIDEVI